jgi:hypothetical protein
MSEQCSLKLVEYLTMHGNKRVAKLAMASGHAMLIDTLRLTFILFYFIYAWPQTAVCR